MWRYNCSENDILSTRKKCKEISGSRIKTPKVSSAWEVESGMNGEEVASTYIYHHV